ncbi:hypothetical protein K2X30_10415 [bacterium]|jgi:hypothetical protein|nr:hypothetical protein [bacterium]
MSQKFVLKLVGVSVAVLLSTAVGFAANPPARPLGPGISAPDRGGHANPPARAIGPGYDPSPSYSYYDSSGYSDEIYYGGGGTTIACAPAQESNLAVVDRTLVDLAQQKEFAEAGLFQEKIREVQTLKSVQEKIAAYLALAKIDAKDGKALVDFVFAREVAQKDVAALQETTGLSSFQAQTVAAAVAKSLRGNLQK